jgi:hypothetical protein
MLTTKQAAALLAERGQPVPERTIRNWCKLGVFPHAARIGSPQRGSWIIPESDLDGFTAPKRGRKPGRTAVANSCNAHATDRYAGASDEPTAAHARAARCVKCT